MVLKSYVVILGIVIFTESTSGLNFHHEKKLEFPLEKLQLPQSSRSQFRNLEEADNKYEIFMKLGNGVTVGCEVEKKPEYDDIVELYLEDEFGRREPEIGELAPVAKFRTANPLFRDPQAAADLLETEVPYGWWPAECIQRIMGLQLESNLCNCPAGPPGLTGRPGSEGLPGPAGPPGKDGRNGTDGQVGPVGELGLQGPRGNKGPKGIPGGQGIPGPVGPAGPAGNPGRDGRPGSPGSPGASGQDGKPGRNGINGRNGRNGVTGPPGSPGLPGNNGVAGVAGLQGEQGIPAPSGANGENGANGLNGLPGTPGANGPCNLPLPPGDDDDTIIIDITDQPGEPEIPPPDDEIPVEEPPSPETGWLAASEPLENSWVSPAPPKPAKPLQTQQNAPSISDLSLTPSSNGAKPAPWSGGSNGQLGAVGNSYWKNSATRSSPNGAGSKPKCAGKKKRGKGKKKAQGNQPLSAESISTPVVVVAPPVADELENVPPRARVDLELEE
ncbi:Collagen alpha-1(X) chain [Orchesella cincta]|uniref:Collagen alpha-1(X) chain n=1 Tax=Orchesella cincta TaxID=48709 RepID=A0A1D2M8W9_ORCCI|nr:Collagen alpha-1(X) chain [Orchesella cincta]